MSTPIQLQEQERGTGKEEGERRREEGRRRREEDTGQKKEGHREEEEEDADKHKFEKLLNETSLSPFEEKPSPPSSLAKC